MPAAAELDEGGLGGRGTRPCVAPHGSCAQTALAHCWAMGRIYEEPGSPQRLRWYWSLYGILRKPLELRTDGRAPTLEAAKAESQARLEAVAGVGGAGRGGVNQVSVERFITRLLSLKLW